jgi:predicted esterase
VGLTAGTRLGPYEVLEPIGAGGMGEVYRARHGKLRRDVAIKVLPTEVAADPVRLARFEREARAASALNHPNIVVIHDIAEHEKTTYIAMELVEGRTLRELIGEGPLAIDRVIRIASQIAGGLAKAHAAGVLHRDVKPANVMVTTDHHVKLLDFGLAKSVAAPAQKGTESAMSTLESAVGVVMGTPLYMSPEQVSGDKVDHRSDQFSFGVVLYEMVGGKPPFAEPSLVRAILAGDPPSLKRLRPDVPADLERIIRRCLEKDPANRYASTADLTAALRRLAERRAGAGHRVARVLRRPAVAVTLGAIAVALGAAGVVWARGAEERWARGEAITVHLFIPRGASPPYQSVVWFPGDDVYLLRSSETLSSAYLVDFIPRSGRVLVHPVYKGMYERFERRAVSPAEFRDRMIRWSQDIGRTLDYLETRPDVDTTKIAYYGLSGGASNGPVLLAIEPRIATAILLGGGLTRRAHRPEAHPAHFAPRMRVPTLMINGYDDFIVPYELSQRPLFEMLGTPDERKKLIRLAGGHIPANRLEIIREVLDWLDRQLGPVSTSSRGEP